MSVSDVQSGPVFEAIKRFDDELRSRPDWVDWERRYDYAIEVKGRLYPAKHILSTATGQRKEDFSGGEQTNRPLRRIGFKIVELPKSVPERDADQPSSRTIRDALEGILRIYGEVRQSTPYGVHEELWSLFETARERFQTSDVVQQHPHVQAIV